ncbi:unnamed protein product [Euphydryas editha]|uniref:Uncharacterized protein n=1 Tax=Euphydryas editha TaxID=104508 RepID=A0AAU9UQF6_EUPED|nr:unnamed protein product [Euphydryas editha]
MSEEAGNQPSTSSGKTESLKFIKRNGGLVLMRAGYQYTIKMEKQKWMYSGYLQIKDGNISNEKSHN